MTIFKNRFILYTQCNILRPSSRVTFIYGERDWSSWCPLLLSHPGISVSAFLAPVRLPLSL